MALEKAHKVSTETLQDDGSQEGDERRQKYELYVTLTGIVCVSILVLLTMGLFGLLPVPLVYYPY